MKNIKSNKGLSKKLLLIGFFISGLFIMYSISSLLGTRVIDESKFLMYNRNYLIINNDIVLELDYENNHYDICVFEYIDGINLQKFLDHYKENKGLPGLYLCGSFGCGKTYLIKKLVEGDK